MNTRKPGGTAKTIHTLSKEFVSIQIDDDALDAVEAFVLNLAKEIQDEAYSNIVASKLLATHIALFFSEMGVTDKKKMKYTLDKMVEMAIDKAVFPIDKTHQC